MFEDAKLEGQRPMPDSIVTVAKFLQTNGYKTGMVGKWGLGTPNTESIPNNKGFDFFYGYNCQRQAHTLYPSHLWRNKEKNVLKPGQYRGSHKLRLHAGKYLALGQKKDVTVYRDNNRDGNYDLDESKTDTGLFGINIHRATGRAGGKSTRVDKWSAGCQVIARNSDFKEFMDICRKAREGKWCNKD